MVETVNFDTLRIIFHKLVNNRALDSHKGEPWRGGTKLHMRNVARGGDGLLALTPYKSLRLV